MTARANRYSGQDFPWTNPKPPRPPEWSFLALVLAALTICSTTFAQLTLSTSSLPITVTLPALNTSTPAFDLSITSLNPITSLYLTLSICSLGSNTSIIPAVLVTTNPGEFDIDENSVSDRNSGGVEKANRRARGGDVWALAWDRGFANWTFVDEVEDDSEDGGVREVVMRIGFAEGIEISEGNVVIQLAAALDGMSNPEGWTDDIEPRQRVSLDMLYLGDTTPTQSLLFSPLLLPAPQSQPTYPNYTLPPAQLRIPPLPAFSFPQLDLLVIPTGSSPTQAGLDNSLCAALNANVSTGALGHRNLAVNATTEWMSVGDEEGYRTYWVIDGLLPSSNYTAWFFEPGTRTLSQPIWFTTKQCKRFVP
jgi:calcium channel MID1